MKFQKKPIIVEAVQLTREMVEAHLFDKAPLPAGIRVCRADWHPVWREIHAVSLDTLTIHDERATVEIGDWVITEPDGVHHYPCKPDIFAATYEPVAV